MPEEPRPALDGPHPTPTDTAATWVADALAKYRARNPQLFPPAVRDHAWQLVHEMMLRDPTLTVGQVVIAMTMGFTGPLHAKEAPRQSPA